MNYGFIQFQTEDEKNFTKQNKLQGRKANYSYHVDRQITRIPKQNKTTRYFDSQPPLITNSSHKKVPPESSRKHYDIKLMGGSMHDISDKYDPLNSRSALMCGLKPLSEKRILNPSSPTSLNLKKKCIYDDLDMSEKSIGEIVVDEYHSISQLHILKEGEEKFVM